MSQILTIIGVTNTAEQLSALPLKAPIRIKFDSEPNLVNADDYIKLLRLSASDGIKSLPESYSDFKTWDESRFADIKIAKEDNDTIAIYAKDVLIEKSDYGLYIGAGLKSASQRQSLDSRIEYLSSDSNLELKITAKSSTITNSSGSRIFVASVTIGGQVIHQSHMITLGSTITLPGFKIKLKEDATFTSGEELIVEAVDYKVLDKDFKLTFSTVSTGVYGEPEIMPEVISRESVKNFFANPFPGVPNPSTPNGGQLTPPSDQKKYEALIRQPNRIIINFNVEIDPSTIDTSNIVAEVEEAFHNYHLEKMGLYKERFYKFSIAMKRNNKRMEITVTPIEDTSAASHEIVLEP